MQLGYTWYEILKIPTWALATRKHFTFHPVAYSEALDVLHWGMSPASYRCIAMAIEIVINLPAFFRPPSMMDAVSATIFDDVQAIRQKHE